MGIRESFRGFPEARKTVPGFRKRSMGADSAHTKRRGRRKGGDAMKARFVAGELLDYLTDGERYPVHSVFSSGFNLKVGPFLGFIGNKRDEKMPFGAVLGRGDTGRLVQEIRPGGTFLAWDGAHRRLYAAGWALELADAARYESAAPRRTVPAGALPLFDGALDLSQPTGLQAAIGMLSGMDWPATAELCRRFEDSDGKRIRMTLKKWVGRGLGLTPSGDDFLTGVLFVDRLSPFLSDAFRRELGALAEEGYTTDIGANYCRCALDGLFCGSLLAFGEALEHGDAAGIKESLERVLRFGHTSGRDTAAGIRLGLQCAGNRVRAESA